MMKEQLGGLCHDPYGLEHPYEQAPTERFPREPVAGQPVALGVATWPVGAAEAVWATWRVAGEAEKHRVDGSWQRNDNDQSYWRVQLSAFEAGQRVTYRLHVSQGPYSLSTEPFSFVVSSWRSIGDVVRYDLSSDGLELECTSSEPGLRPCFSVRFPGPHQLWVRLAAKGSATLGQPRSCAHVPQRSGGDELAYEIVEEAAEHFIVATEGLRVAIRRHPCQLEVSLPDGRPLLREAEPLVWLVGEEARALRVRESFVTPPNEAFCGFGERFNALDQRGNELDVRVYDQYKNQGLRTYVPVPFFLSSRGYGLHIDTSRHVAYDLAASHPDHWSFDAELGPDGVLEYHLIANADPRQVIGAFTDLVGKPVQPPKWAFGPWMSGNEWNSQARVMEEVHTSIRHRIPATVLVIEAWSDESTFYIWNDAQYAPKPAAEGFTYGDFAFGPEGRWPDPKGMVEQLHRLGMRVLLWQVPVMKKLDRPHKQHDLDEAYMIEQGYCVHEADGRPYRIGPFWFHDGLLMDVTNPEAVQWWLRKRVYLLDELRVDGFKTDGGEHLWGRDTRFADGRRGDELWNLYPNLYAGAYHRFACGKRDGDAITFSRAGFTGAQAYPCHWAGDENSTWEAFRASILAGLSAGISGIPFWGWDLGGFSGETPTAELYLRAAAMATFCPIMQYHSEYNEHRMPCRDRTPWNIAERTGQPEVIEIYRSFAQLRMRLLPYIEDEAARCAETGEPLMRALFLDWPDDPEAPRIPDQYCFGRALLVAPVVEPGVVERHLYLPSGEWEDFWDGRRLSGGRWITRPAPLDIIPVYRRLDVLWPGLANWPE